MRTAILLFSGAIATCASAQVTYHFEGASGVPGSLFPQSFTLELPDYITADRTFRASELQQCTVVIQTCTSIGFVQVDPNNPAQSVIDFRAETATTHYYFTSGAFTRPGEYRMVASDLFNPATLWVTGPAVPEPATAWLALAGLAGLGLRSARSKAKA